MSARRTWDRDIYEKKAALRAEREQYEGLEGAEGQTSSSLLRSDKEEFKVAPDDISGPMGSNRAFISARDGKISAEKEVGKVKVVTAAQMEVGDGAGFYCEVCKSLLKDDRAYLNHVNGKNHQRALGFSMRVERAAVSSVKEKLQNLKRKKLGDKEVDKMIEPVVEVHDSRKQINKEKKKEQRGLGGQEGQEDGNTWKKRKQAEKEEDEEEQEVVDPEMATIMGFGGFGGSKKKL